MAWSPDGSRVFAAGFGHMWMFRAYDGVLLARVRASYLWGSTRSAVFSPDGQFVIAASPAETTLDIRRSSDLGIARRIAAVGARCVAYSPDGSKLAVGFADGSVRLLDPATGTTQATLLGHSSAVNDVAFSPDGVMLVSGSNDATGRIWNLGAGTSVQLPSGSTYPVDKVDYSADGTRVATAAYPYITIWNAPSGTHVQQITAGSQGAVSFAPGGSTVIGAMESYHLAEWNIADGSQVRQFTAAGWAGRRIAMDPAGARVASAGSNVQVYQASDGQLLAEVGALGFPVAAMAWSPDGASVYAVHASWPGTLVSGWEVATGTHLGDINVPEADVWAAAFSADVSRVALAGSGIVAAYEVATGTRMWDLALPAVQGLAMSPDGARVAIVDFERLYVRNMADGSPVLDLPIDSSYGYPVCVAVSPDGAEVAVGTSYGYVLLVDVAFGSVVAHRIPYAYVKSVTYVRDGQKLIVGTSGMLGDAAHIIRRSDGRLLAKYSEEMARSIANADTDPAGTMWCYAREDGAVVMADMPDTSNEAQLGLQGATGVVGEQVELVATLTDTGGTPLPGMEVHFFRNGFWDNWGYVGTALTDTAGVARLTHTLQGPTGMVSYLAAFGGGHGFEYAATNAWFDIQTPATRMFMLNRAGAIDSTVGIRAFLTTVSGLPIGNKVLNYTLDGSDIGTAITDVNGRATLWYVVPNTILPGAHPIGASFAGDGTYPAASASATLMVSKGTSILWVMPRSVQRGVASYLRALVRNDLLIGLPGLQVNYKLDGTAIGSATTDANGRSALLHTVPASTTPGNLTLECSFAGNAYYLPSSGLAAINVLP